MASIPASLGIFAEAFTEPAPGQMLVRCFHPGYKRWAPKRKFHMLVTKKGLESLKEKDFSPRVMQKGLPLPDRDKKKMPAAMPRPVQKKLFPAVRGGATVAQQTVMLGKAPSMSMWPTQKSCEKAGRIPHFDQSSGKYTGCWSPPTAGSAVGDGGYPVAVGEGEQRVYNPWMIMLGVGIGHVGWTTGTTLMESLPAKDGILYKIVPWAELGIGALNILLAYLARGHAIPYGMALSGTLMIPRGVALAFIRILEGRQGLSAPAGAPGAKSAQFTPEEETLIRSAEQKLLEQLGESTAGARGRVAGANVQDSLYGEQRRW